MAEEKCDNGCFVLNTGAILPSVGLGTFDSEPGVVGDAVTAAVKLGYRHIDCARVYHNEKEIGAALKKLVEDGVVKRQDLWITSKLWCSDHAPEDVANAAEATLHDLQLDYLDLYLIHWPAKCTKGGGYEKSTFTLPDTPATWRAMEELFYAGKARAIGVSNFSSKKLGDLLDVARVAPAVNQVECNPLWQQEKLRAFCRLKGVHLSDHTIMFLKGYSPLGTPRWAKKNIPEWEKRLVMKHPVVNMVAEKLGKTPAQVALRWGVQMGHSILPKSSNEARIKENWDVFNWSIPQHLMTLFSEIEQERVVKGSIFVDEEHGPYRSLDELWDGEV